MTQSQPSRPIVIDADAHVVETERTWDYLEPEHAKYRPKLASIQGEAAVEYWIVNERIGGVRLPTLSEKALKARSNDTGRRLYAPSAAIEMDDVSLRLAAMDELGIDIQVLYNTLWLQSVSDVPEIEGALRRSWNRWVADIHKQSNGRLYWTRIVPTFDRDMAIEEMRCAHQHGAVGLCLRPFEGDLLVTDPEFYPLFEEAVRLDMPIAVHIGNGNPELTRLLRTRYPTMGGWAMTRVPAVVAAMAILTSSVTENFPTLRWGVIEASAAWIPWLCHEVQRRTGRPFGPDSNPFVDHNIYVTAQVDDDITYLSQAIGESLLMIGTDYGHTDTSSDYDALTKFTNLSTVDESMKRRMLSDNPAAFYALDAFTPALN